MDRNGNSNGIADGNNRTVAGRNGNNTIVAINQMLEGLDQS